MQSETHLESYRSLQPDLIMDELVGQQKENASLNENEIEIIHQDVFSNSVIKMEPMNETIESNEGFEDSNCDEVTVSFEAVFDRVKLENETATTGHVWGRALQLKHELHREMNEDENERSLPYAERSLLANKIIHEDVTLNGVIKIEPTNETILMESDENFAEPAGDSETNEDVESLPYEVRNSPAGDSPNGVWTMDDYFDSSTIVELVSAETAKEQQETVLSEKCELNIADQENKKLKQAAANESKQRVSNSTNKRETPEQNRKISRVSTRRIRANETPEQRRKRLANRRERMRKIAKETPEQREKRRKISRERNRQMRANETPEQREKRLAYHREWRRKIANEMPEQEENRRKISREYFRQMRANETPEQREKRLACSRERYRKITNYIAEERRKRLLSDKFDSKLQRRAIVVLERCAILPVVELVSAETAKEQQKKFQSEKHQKLRRKRMIEKEMLAERRMTLQSNVIMDEPVAQQKEKPSLNENEMKINHEGVVSNKRKSEDERSLPHVECPHLLKDVLLKTLLGTKPMNESILIESGEDFVESAENVGIEFVASDDHVVLVSPETVFKCERLETNTATTGKRHVWGRPLQLNLPSNGQTNENKNEQNLPHERQGKSETGVRTNAQVVRVIEKSREQRLKKAVERKKRMIAIAKAEEQEIRLASKRESMRLAHLSAEEQETPKQREKRLAYQRACNAERKRRKIANETAEEEEERLVIEADEQIRTLNANESAEQLEKRLERKAEENRQLKADDTPEQIEKRFAYHRAYYAQIRANLSAEKRERRLASKRESRRRRIANLSAEELEKRRAYNAEWRRQRIANETAEEREKRLLRAAKFTGREQRRAYCVQKRANLSAEKREKISANYAEWRRRRQANETPEERERRLAHQAAWQRQRMANLSAEKREQKNTYNAEWRRRRQANETPEEREKRRAYKAAWKKRRLANETAEQREQRRASKAEWEKLRMAKETAEERKKRLLCAAEGRRQRKKAREMMERDIALASAAGKIRSNRTNEIAEEGEERLAWAAWNRSQRRAKEMLKCEETPEQLREKRRANNRAYYVQKIANETAEQRKKRQKKARKSATKFGARRRKFKKKVEGDVSLASGAEKNRSNGTNETAEEEDTRLVFEEDEGQKEGSDQSKDDALTASCC